MPKKHLPWAKLPSHIRGFELLTALSVAFDSLDLIPEFQFGVKVSGPDQWFFVAASALASFALFQTLFVLNVYFITRRRSVVAQWIFVASLAGAICLRILFPGAMVRTGLFLWLSYASTLIGIYMAWLLFTPRFRKWLGA
ncbi:MAG TPA: hypothetical protein VK914_00010 [bacterium]|jgi:hypothetical protein|nr:hypothetical protein [bacterium]